MLNKKTFGHRKPSRRSAFSLIELSIVLIIIGLLISGIIGGASLIKSATLRSVMTEARGYNIATSAFYTKYNTLPGDYNAGLIGNGITLANGVGDVGNGDGVISYVNGIGASSNAENQIAIKQLYADGSLDISMFGTYPYLSTVIPQQAAGAVAALSPRTALPGGKLKGSGWFFDNYQSNGAGSDNANFNVAVLSGGVNAKTYVASTALNAAGSSAAAVDSWTVLSVVPILTPQDARSIDVKMDDGLPATGTIRSAAASLGAANTAAASCTSDTTPASAPAAADTYNLTASTVNCALAFRIDTTS